jgi:hypothetical protein
MLKRALGFSLMATVGLLSVAVPGAQAAAPDYSCYMELGSSRVVDLTRSVCGFSADKAAKSAATDAAYIQAVKKLIGSDRRTLEMIDTNPGLLVAAAQNYCSARESGMSEQQYMESLYKDLISSSSGADMGRNSEQSQLYEATFMANGLAAELAPKHYCPSVKRRY